MDADEKDVWAVATGDYLTLVDEAPVLCCGCASKAKGRYKDQNFALTYEDMTCQTSLGGCCCRLCCCGCNVLQWLTGVNKWVMIAVLVVLFGGFVTLCVFDKEAGLFVGDLIVGFFQFLFSPTGMWIVGMIAAFVVFRMGLDWIRSHVPTETLRRWANYLNGLPLPFKILGGVLAAGCLVAAIGPAAVGFVAAGVSAVGSAAIAFGGIAAAVGSVGYVTYSIVRGNRETRDLIKLYGDQLVEDVARLQKICEEGFERLEKRLDLMEKRILDAIKRVEDKVDLVLKNMDHNHRQLMRQFTEIHKREILAQGRKLRVAVDMALEKAQAVLEVMVNRQDTLQHANFYDFHHQLDILQGLALEMEYTLRRLMSETEMSGLPNFRNDCLELVIESLAQRQAARSIVFRGLVFLGYTSELLQQPAYDWLEGRRLARNPKEMYEFYSQIMFPPPPEEENGWHNPFTFEMPIVIRRAYLENILQDARWVSNVIYNGKVFDWRKSKPPADRGASQSSPDTPHILKDDQDGDDDAMVQRPPGGVLFRGNIVQSDDMNGISGIDLRGGGLNSVVNQDEKKKTPVYLEEGVFVELIYNFVEFNVKLFVERLFHDFFDKKIIQATLQYDPDVVEEFDAFLDKIKILLQFSMAMIKKMPSVIKYPQWRITFSPNEALGRLNVMKQALPALKGKAARKKIIMEAMAKAEIIEHILDHEYSVDELAKDRRLDGLAPGETAPKEPPPAVQRVQDFQDEQNPEIAEEVPPPKTLGMIDFAEGFKRKKEMKDDARNERKWHAARERLKYDPQYKGKFDDLTMRVFADQEQKLNRLGSRRERSSTSIVSDNPALDELTQMIEEEKAKEPVVRKLDLDAAAAELAGDESLSNSQTPQSGLLQLGMPVNAPPARGPDSLDVMDIEDFEFDQDTEHYNVAMGIHDVSMDWGSYYRSRQRDKMRMMYGNRLSRTTLFLYNFCLDGLPPDALYFSQQDLGLAQEFNNPEMTLFSTQTRSWHETETLKKVSKKKFKITLWDIVSHASGAKISEAIDVALRKYKARDLPVDEGVEASISVEQGLENLDLDRAAAVIHTLKKNNALFCIIIIDQ